MISTTAFQGKKVLITGGVGFLGSNLAISLVKLGAEVTLVDSMIPGYGGNLFNIAPIANQVKVNFADVRDQNVMNYLVVHQDYVFHLAGQVDHVLSLSNPFPDIDINIIGTAVLMEALRHHNPRAKVIYTGTRGQYGETATLPVAEDAPLRPKGLHEISNLTAEQIIYMYHAVHHIPAVLLRLTNIYGERSQMRHPRYGVVNWFIRLAIDNETIKVFGDGKILRDFLYVEDTIDAMLMVAITEAAYGEILNVASGSPFNFIELATALIEVAGSGRWEFSPFSPERAAQEPGDFYADIRKIERLVAWRPKVSLREGLEATIKFYREHRIQYWS
jgi:UDP-glucose 4-epimerase